MDQQSLWGKSGQSYPFRYPQLQDVSPCGCCFLPCRSIKAFTGFPKCATVDGAGPPVFTVRIFSTCHRGCTDRPYARSSRAKVCAISPGSRHATGNVFAPVALPQPSITTCAPELCEPRKFTCTARCEQEALVAPYSTGVPDVWCSQRPRWCLPSHGRTTNGTARQAPCHIVVRNRR